MKIVLFLVVALCLFVGVFSQGDCEPNIDCQTCTELSHCGWCAPTQQCLPGDEDGPSGGKKCMGSAWEYGKCTKCEELLDCKTCLGFSSDCFWCVGQNGTQASCKPIGFIGCHEHHFNSCPCNNYHTCSACTLNSRGDCEWCNKDQTCRKKNDQSCELTKTCPCSESPDCTDCLQTSGCFWCFLDGTCRPNTDHTCPIEVGGCDTYCSMKGAAGCSACRALTGCAWCLDKNSCHDVNTALCQTHGECPFDCSIQTSCDGCLSNRHCKWCKNKCIRHSESDCATGGYTCNSQVKRFSGSSFVGGMFLVIGILFLSMIGYFVYRWKVNQNPSYSELK